jgi:nicotinamidase-related amidase
MPLTRIDEGAALLVIDLQKGIVALPTVHAAAEIVQRAAQLAMVFRERRLPVILVNVAGLAPGRVDLPFRASLPSDWTELVPELGRRPTDYAVTKMQVGAFYGTALDQILRRRAVTQLFLVGITTSSGVEATARNAYDRGYNVVLVVDAMTDLSSEAHRHCVETTFPRIGEVSTTDDVSMLLTRRLAAP